MKQSIRRFLIVFLLSATMTTATACTAGTTNNMNNKDEDFHIVTSFYPMYVFTKNIVGTTPGVSIENMTQPQTGCLHDYSLKPSDLKTLETADAFVINGGGMESFLDKVLVQYTNLTIIEAGKDIPLLKDKNGETNPHIWVSVSGAIAEVKQIAKQLSVADPIHAKDYNNNAESYIESLEALSKTMHESLSPYEGEAIVTFHEAFPYFADEFKLLIVAVIEREPGSEPGAGELADTLNIIREKNVHALFAEPQYSTRAAQTIADETGAKIYSLDPFVTGSTDDPLDRYQTVMLENMKTLISALGQ